MNVHLILVRTLVCALMKRFPTRANALETLLDPTANVEFLTHFFLHLKMTEKDRRKVFLGLKIH